MILKNHEYDDKIPTSSEYYGRPTRWDSMRWYLVMKWQPWLYFLDCYSLIVNLVFQTAATFNVQLHSIEVLSTLSVKCFRRTVWETRHSGATGWEQLSHISDVWCSSLQQLTRSFNWQRESLSRCQMWPHWMYVSNICNQVNE